MDRLLVMDDEIELGRFVGRVAESIGYQVKITSREQDFKDAVNNWKPSAIILDLAMPEADGFELLRWMASENCQSQIVIMSGYDTGVVDAAKRIGQERGLNISFTFSKPMRVQEISEKLNELKKIEATKHKNFKPVREDELDRSISEGELFLLYQPKVVLKTGGLRGVEALVRWRHPERGIIPPDQFIALAEETGLIDGLTDFVFAEAVRQQKIWNENGLDIQVAVNLSAFSLRNSNLADRIAALCHAEGVPPDRLTIEITETAAMNNALEALDTLTRLRLKGFKLSIDDFARAFRRLRACGACPSRRLRSTVRSSVKCSSRRMPL